MFLVFFMGNVIVFRRIFRRRKYEQITRFQGSSATQAARRRSRSRALIVFLLTHCIALPAIGERYRMQTDINTNELTNIVLNITCVINVTF